MDRAVPSVFQLPKLPGASQGFATGSQVSEVEKDPIDANTFLQQHDFSVAHLFPAGQYPRISYNDASNTEKITTPLRRGRFQIGLRTPKREKTKDLPVFNNHERPDIFIVSYPSIEIEQLSEWGLIHIERRGKTDQEEGAPFDAPEIEPSWNFYTFVHAGRAETSTEILASANPSSSTKDSGQKDFWAKYTGNDMKGRSRAAKFLSLNIAMTADRSTHVYRCRHYVLDKDENLLVASDYSAPWTYTRQRLKVRVPSYDDLVGNNKRQKLDDGDENSEAAAESLIALAHFVADPSSLGDDDSSAPDPDTSFPLSPALLSTQRRTSSTSTSYLHPSSSASAYDLPPPLPPIPASLNDEQSRFEMMHFVPPVGWFPVPLFTVGELSSIGWEFGFVIKELGGKPDLLSTSLTNGKAGSSSEVWGKWNQIAPKGVLISKTRVHYDLVTIPIKRKSLRESSQEVEIEIMGYSGGTVSAAEALLRPRRLGFMKCHRILVEIRQLPPLLSNEDGETDSEEVVEFNLFLRIEMVERLAQKGFEIAVVAEPSDGGGG